MEEDIIKAREKEKMNVDLINSDLVRTEEDAVRCYEHIINSLFMNRMIRETILYKR